jgi:hypothetical protein
MYVFEQKIFRELIVKRGERYFIPRRHQMLRLYSAGTKIEVPGENPVLVPLSRCGAVTNVVFLLAVCFLLGISPASEV